MSVLDQIKALDEQRNKLLADAKQEALGAANAAIATLKELGFNYSLSLDQDTSTASTGSRRTGVRDAVLNVVSGANGISRADILEQMDAKGDKRAEQSISNALANLKKADKIDLNDGVYTVKGA